MSNEFKQLLNIVFSSAMNTPIKQIDCEIDWSAFFRLAKEQTVLTLAMFACYDHPELGGQVEYGAEFQPRLFSMLGNECIRRNAIYQLLQEMDKANIPYAVLKGIGISALYAEPECRNSGDIDLYVDIRDEARTQKLFREYGIQVKARHPEAKEGICYHPVIGTIELHIDFFNRMEKNTWFSDENLFTGITEPFRKLRMPDGNTISVLSETDDLFFLTFHFLKHFIKGGISLRHMIDLVLFIQCNHEKCNMDLYWERLRNLQFDGVINTVLSAVVYECQIDPLLLPGMTMMPQSTVEAFLRDVEIGGWLGNHDQETRSDSAELYSAMLQKHKGKGANSRTPSPRYHRLISYLRSIFCTKAYLQMKYPYAQKNVLLLPAAWAEYLANGIKKVCLRHRRSKSIRKKIEDASQTHERMNLFKLLGMI